MNDYRTNVGLAALAFALAAVAGFLYGARIGVPVIGILLLIVALAWGLLWLAAGRDPGAAPGASVQSRTTLARLAWIAALVLAVILFVAAAVAD